MSVWLVVSQAPEGVLNELPWSLQQVLTGFKRSCTGTQHRHASSLICPSTGPLTHTSALPELLALLQDDSVVTCMEFGASFRPSATGPMLLDCTSCTPIFQSKLSLTKVSHRA
jgi:hypothetical protein